MEKLQKLIKDYQIAYENIKQYIGFIIGIGYPISKKCPKCNYLSNEERVKMFFCSDYDIMSNTHMSRHYSHLCNKCEENIIQIYQEIHDICVNKIFNIMRSNGQIELWRCHTFYPIVDEPNEYDIIFIMRYDIYNLEKHVKLEDMIKINQ